MPGTATTQDMKPSRIPISTSVWLLAAVITAMMTGCHSGGGGCVSGTECLVRLEGTLSGLVGSDLVLADESQFSSGFDGTAANGTQVAFGAAFNNEAYNLTVQTQPSSPSQTCVVTNGTGTTGN